MPIIRLPQYPDAADLPLLAQIAELPLNRSDTVLAPLVYLFPLFLVAVAGVGVWQFLAAAGPAAGRRVVMAVTQGLTGLLAGLTIVVLLMAMASVDGLQSIGAGVWPCLAGLIGCSVAARVAEKAIPKPVRWSVV